MVRERQHRGMMGCRRLGRLVAQRQVQHWVRQGQKVPRQDRMDRKDRKDQRVLRRVRKDQKAQRRVQQVLLVPILGALVLPSPLEIRERERG